MKVLAFTALMLMCYQSVSATGVPVTSLSQTGGETRAQFQHWEDEKAKSLEKLLQQDETLLGEQNAELAKLAAEKSALKKELEALLSGSPIVPVPAALPVSAPAATRAASLSDGPGDYAASLKIVKAMQAKLLAYYSNDRQYLDDSVIRGAAKNSDKTLEARMAMAMSGKSRKEFIIACGGSSVTAGHDGFGQVAWPGVIERTLAPAWKALGVDFVVRNSAVGGRNPNPWPFCGPNMFGEDADVVMREWEYWPFAAGFEREVVTKQGKSADMAAVEILLRNALLLSKQPAVHFVKMSVDGGGKLGMLQQVS
jgi:hypothetical protein